MESIGTVIKKKDQLLAIFQVKPEIIMNPKKSAEYRMKLRTKFKHVPIILISMIEGEIQYEGKQHDIELIKDEALNQYSWKRYINV